MASFSAELHVAGVVIPLIRCTYSTHQSTDARGRVITKVRKSPIDCEADVPEQQVLDAWAADAHKRQEAIIIFRHADTGAAWETLHLKAAYCVRYTEVFVMGDLTSGSYRCFFTLADPDGWIWYPGGLPDEAAIRPPAREHGRPVQAMEQEALGLEDAGALAGETDQTMPSSSITPTGAYNPNSAIAVDGYRTAAVDVVANTRSIGDALLTRIGIDTVTQHLSRNLFLTESGGMSANNAVMISRLENALAGRQPFETTDQYFYSHELREAELMDKQGMSYDQGHATACKEYGVTAAMEKNNVFYTSEALAAWEQQQRASLGF